MADRFAVHPAGLADLQRELRQVKDKELDNELKAIHKALADEVLARALPNVPEASGALKASVRSAGTKRDAIGRAGKASVPYAPIVHWGWPARGVQSRPFLREASLALEADITDRYDQAVATMLDRVIGEH